MKMQTLRCYGDDYVDMNSPGTWNVEVDRDTLAIHTANDKYGASYATVGYMPADDGHDDPGRHSMTIHTGLGADVTVHEVRL